MKVRRRLPPLVALAFLIALAVVMAGVFPFRQIINQQTTVQATQDKLDALVAENARLETEIEQLQTPEEIERLARERFGLVREGEVGYVVGWVEDETPVTPEPTLPPPDRRPWYERLWDFASGNDVRPGE